MAYLKSFALIFFFVFISCGKQTTPLSKSLGKKHNASKWQKDSMFIIQIVGPHPFKVEPGDVY